MSSSLCLAASTVTILHVDEQSACGCHVDYKPQRLVVAIYTVGTIFYACGRSAVTPCDGSGLTMPDLSTVLVHEIKLTGQESHDGKHFVDLLTSDDAERRSTVARPVAPAFEYAASATMVVAYLHALDTVHTCPSLLYLSTYVGLSVALSPETGWTVA